MQAFLAFSVLFIATVELESSPAWESTDSDYSTGGILADIDSDGDMDLVTGNGNDMARNPNRVYYNENDMLEKTASWSSQDIACNGHVSLGDMDSDGDLDLAVAGFAYYNGWQSDPSRVYLNEEGVFTSNPVWLGADTFHAFSCDWGDADQDGDLDLAIAAGNDYDNRRQKVVIFENTGGTLSSIPMWESEDSDFNMDVCWVDADSDGDLDLAAGGYKHNRIYFMHDGVLNSEAGWISADSHHTVQTAFADFNSDGYLDMATADNNQIADDESRIRLYLNHSGQLDTLPFWESKLWQYQSCVAWGDVDSDGDLDLAAGGWWEPASVYENVEGVLDTTPAWTWSPSLQVNLVCEQIMWGEVDNDNWGETTEDFGVLSGGQIAYPSHFPALDIIEVKINGTAALAGDFLWNPADGWIQLNKPGSVKVTYRYSKYPDLLVTNWAQLPGNFLFLNTGKDTTSVVAERFGSGGEILLAKTVLSRGETLRLILPLSLKVEIVSLFDVTGNRVSSFVPEDFCSTLDLPFETSTLPRGVYILHISTDTGPLTLRFQLL